MSSKFLLGSVMALMLIPAAPAAATGVSNDSFDVSGNLTQFPCPTGCPASFSGTATGATYAHPTINAESYDAAIIFDKAQVGGSVVYTEQGGPTCGLAGFANQATLRITADPNQASGVIVRESDYLRGVPTGGAINGVDVTLNFDYTRVGFLSLITLNSGTLTGYYFYPGITPLGGRSSFTETLDGNGEAAAVFEVLPNEVTAACDGSASGLHYRLIGDAIARTK